MLKMTDKKEGPVSPPPRPPAPKFGKKQSAKGAGYVFRFNAASLDEDLTLDDDCNVISKTKDTTVFPKSESTGAISSLTSTDPLSIPRDSNSESSVLKSTASLSQPLPRSVSGSSYGSSSSGEMSPPVRRSPSRGKLPREMSRGLVKVENEVIADGDDQQWFSGSKDADIDPLTMFSQQQEEDIFENNTAKDFSPASLRKNITSNNSETHTPQINGSPHHKSRSESFKIVDEYYEPEPYEEFDGGVNTQLLKRSSAGVQQSGATAVGSSPSRAKGLVKKIIKGKQKEDSVGALSFSTLMADNTAVVERELQEVYHDAEEVKETKDKDAASEKTSKDAQSVNRTISIDLEKPSPIPVKTLLIWTAAIFLYYILPLPSYVSGMISGGLIVYFVNRFITWWTMPPPPKEPMELPDLDDLPPLTVPEMKENKNDDGIFRGWMNQLPHKYEQDSYHISQTHSIFVRLEGTSLRLSMPVKNVPKRAMWNEGTHNPKFKSQQHIELKGCIVFLMPPGLVKKRVWSKKYPICIKLKDVKKKNSQQNIEPAVPVGKEESSDNFEVVDKEMCDDGCLYLFARTGREKEQWYRRFDAASQGMPLTQSLKDMLEEVRFQHRRSGSSGSIKSHRRQGSSDSVKSLDIVGDSAETEDVTKTLKEYAKYMAKLMPSTEHEKSNFPGSPKRMQKTIVCDESLYWVNTLIGRGFWDFLREKKWADKCAEKIQKKLDKIHVPYFIDALTITDIELGAEMPTIRRATRPYLDDQGLWIDLDISYNGDFSMTLETKVNLMKLKKKEKNREMVPVKPRENRKSAATDSEEEDSGESSSDEEVPETNGVDETDEGKNHTTTGRKFLRILDKITETKYFQKATEFKYVKKAMEGVSNTPLVLNVEVKSLVGTLAINIPPPPTDRLWYGFRTNPRLWLAAKPKVGERQLSYTRVTDWIEKKLTQEFQRIFVMPNMDDLQIPTMLSKLDTAIMPRRCDSSSSS